MKVGYQAAYEVTDIFGNYPTHGLQYRFNAGVPDLITQRITRWQQANRTRYDAFYVQDQWTRSRLTMQGGFTSGAGTRDQCEIWAALPELIGSAQTSACRIEEPWLWNWRGLVNYTVPRIDVQVSAIMRSQANIAATNDPASTGQSLSADYFESNANVIAALGRPIAGGGATVTLDLARQGEVYPDRLNTVDMRFTKILRIGRTRTNVGVDLYNLFNANTGVGFNQNFGADGAAWLRPNAVLNPRYVRFNATVDF